MNATVEEKDLYRAFTPRERITLMLEAMAREDHVERERLMRSCPKYTYTSSDHEYTDGLEEAFGIASLTACSLRHYTGHVLAVETVARGMKSLLPSLIGDLPECAF